MAIPTTQTAVIQSLTPARESGISLAISTDQPVPALPSPHHILVRVLAVGLNPTDFKMVSHFFMAGVTAGCDFCGTVVQAGASSLHPVGTRVCAADFPYRPGDHNNGAFAQYAVADSRHALRVPKAWSDLQGAAVGAIGWATSALAISDPAALGLPGRPGVKVEGKAAVPVLVWGGATATGIMAIQMLRQSGYSPIAVCSDKSAPEVLKYGAVGTASYTSKDCVEKIKALANGQSIKHALDCITDADSTAGCYAALARVGARYACLEDCPTAWRTRSAVKVKAVMGYEALGYDVTFGHETYDRKVNWELHHIAAQWAVDIQSLLDEGTITSQKIREVDGGFEGVIKAVEILQRGEQKGEKLVVRLATS